MVNWGNNIVESMKIVQNDLIKYNKYDHHYY
jgi:hypothetical protein